MSIPISLLSIPARSIAVSAALSASSQLVSFSQKCLSLIPVFEYIHSSLVSTTLLRSSLVTTLSGTACPVETTFIPTIMQSPKSGFLQILLYP